MTISSLTSANVSATYAAAANAAKATVTNVAAAAPKASASAVTVSISSAGRVAAATAAVTYTNMTTFKADLKAIVDAGAALPTPVTKTASNMEKTYDLKISSTELLDVTNLANLKLANAAGKIKSIALTDATVTLDQLATTQKFSAMTSLLAKVSSAHTVVLTKTLADDVASLNASSAVEKLNIQVSDTGDKVKTNLTALQTAAKAKTLTKVEMSSKTSATWSMTAADYTKTNADLMKILKNTTSNTDLTISVTGASVKNYTDFKTSKLLDQNIKNVTVSDTAAAIISGKTTLKADTKVTAVEIKDSIANIVKAGDVSGAKALLSATIAPTDTTAKPAAVTVANALKAKDLLISATLMSIADTARNIVNQKNNETNSTYTSATGAKAVLGSIGTTGVAGVKVTDTNFIMSIADVKTLKSVSADIDLSKISYKISDTSANVAANTTDASVMNASGIIFTSNVSISDAVKLGDLSQKQTPGAVSVYDSAANVTAKSADDLAALKAKGFMINIADTATNVATKFTEISARIASINDIVFDGDQNPATNVADTVAADKKFAKDTVLTGHSDVLGHVVTPDYSVATS